MIRNLKYLRMRDKLSQQQLAERIGVSQQSVNKYENHNVEPDLETLIAIADFFSTSVDFLIGHTEIEETIEPRTAFALTKSEREWLEKYRRLNETEKQIIALVMENHK